MWNYTGRRVLFYDWSNNLSRSWYNLGQTSQSWVDGSTNPPMNINVEIKLRGTDEL